MGTVLAAQDVLDAPYWGAAMTHTIDNINERSNSRTRALEAGTTPREFFAHTKPG
jgi:hypothetical protein